MVVFYLFILIWFGLIIFVALATWALPLPGKLIALVINFFIPEGLPFIDETIQVVGILKHFSRN